MIHYSFSVSNCLPADALSRTCIFSLKNLLKRKAFFRVVAFLRSPCWDNVSLIPAQIFVLVQGAEMLYSNRYSYKLRNYLQSRVSRFCPRFGEFGHLARFNRTVKLWIHAVQKVQKGKENWLGATPREPTPATPLNRHLSPVFIQTRHKTFNPLPLKPPVTSLPLSKHTPPPSVTLLLPDTVCAAPGTHV